MKFISFKLMEGGGLNTGGLKSGRPYKWQFTVDDYISTHPYCPITHLALSCNIKHLVSTTKEKKRQVKSWCSTRQTICINFACHL